MPRNTREWAHRGLKNSRGNIEWALKHLLDVYNVYLPEHPEIAEPVNTVMEALDMLQETIIKIEESF